MIMKTPYANPLFARLTRSASSPSLRATLWLGFGLVLATLALIMLAILLGDASETRWVIGSLDVAANIFMFITMMIISVIAANLTAREVGREAFQLLRMTDISRDTIVHGFVLATLYRVRVLLALLVAVLPIVVVHHILINRAIVSENDCYAFVTRLGSPDKFRYEDTAAYLRPPLNRRCVSPSDVRLFYNALLSLPGVLANWGMGLFAAAVGVDLGLTWRRTRPAVILAPLITSVSWFWFSLILIVIGQARFFTGPYEESSCSPAGCVFLYNWLSPLVFKLAYAAIIYTIGISIVIDTKDRVWGRTTARRE